MHIKFKKPEEVDIVILDSNGEYLFTNHVIDKRYTCKVVESEVNIFFITPSMIWRLIKNIIKIKNKEKNILSYLYKIYLLSTINLYNPKIVITFIDNNLLYHWLIRNDSSMRYMAIQNGIRQKFEFDMSRKISPEEINHDYYFCFGNYDIDFHKKMGFHINKAFPCGSLRLGISQLKFKDISKKYDICLLSNYKSKYKIQKFKFRKEMSENNMLLDKYLKDYCQNNDKSIVIAIRSKSDEEINYYKSIFGNDVNLTTGQVQSYSSYKASGESKVTVAYQSTLLLEMLAIKNKVLHIDFTDNKNLFDYDPPIKYKFISYNDMQDKINAIYNMNIDDYIKMTKNQQEYVMNYNSDNPPHKVINNQINSIMNTKNYVS